MVLEDKQVSYIHDNGIGFPMKYKEKVFDVFRDYTGRMSTRALVSALRLSSGSSLAMAERSLWNPWKMWALRSISHSNERRRGISIFKSMSLLHNQGISPAKKIRNSACVCRDEDHLVIKGYN